MKCQACGVEKDMSVLEVYPYEGRICTDEAMPPIISGLPCQCNDGTFREVDVCHECFHKLDADMWISEKCWEAINPVTPISQLRR